MNRFSYVLLGLCLTGVQSEAKVLGLFEEIKIGVTGNAAFGGKNASDHDKIFDIQGKEAEKKALSKATVETENGINKFFVGGLEADVIGFKASAFKIGLHAGYLYHYGFSEIDKYINFSHFGKFGLVFSYNIAAGLNVFAAGFAGMIKNEKGGLLFAPGFKAGMFYNIASVSIEIAYGLIKPFGYEVDGSVDALCFASEEKQEEIAKKNAEQSAVLILEGKVHTPKVDEKLALVMPCIHSVGITIKWIVK